VNHGVATGKTGAKRFRLAQVAYMRFACNAFKVGKIAGSADQHPQICALGSECASHMMAHKPGRACKENFHIGCQ
jgi:hypothetical protein